MVGSCPIKRKKGIYFPGVLIPLNFIFDSPEQPLNEKYYGIASNISEINHVTPIEFDGLRE